MKRRTKIICTLGPASQREDTITKMAREGMNVARINFSHGDEAQHEGLIRAVRLVNKKRKQSIGILQDLEGYRIRIGHLERPFELMKYQTVFMSNIPGPQKAQIPLDADIDIRDFKKGMDVFIDDGKIHLKVIQCLKDKIELEVVQGGTIKSRKGVNIPRLKIKTEILTAKDRMDIEFGIKHKVDFIAQSFVRNKEDVMRVVEIVKPRLPKCLIVAKIENEEGVKNLHGIMAHCDLILVARGDLGVSLPIYQIPIIQKDILRCCIKKGEPSIVATQMLESMTESARPTRAEVSDVANAIFDGADYVMLSGETAAGNFPVKCVRMMHQIVEFTEAAMRRPKSKIPCS